MPNQPQPDPQVAAESMADYEAGRSAPMQEVIDELAPADPIEAPAANTLPNTPPGKDQPLTETKRQLLEEVVAVVDRLDDCGIPLAWPELPLIGRVPIDSPKPDPIEAALAKVLAAVVCDRWVTGRPPKCLRSTVNGVYRPCTNSCENECGHLRSLGGRDVEDILRGILHEQFGPMLPRPVATFDKRGADRLAYACAVAVTQGRLSSRSDIADALCNYLEACSGGGPASISHWIEEYDRRLVENFEPLLDEERQDDA